MLKTEFINYLHSGLYDKAKELVSAVTFDAFYDFMLQMSFKDGSLMPYGFIIFMITEKESAQLHHTASVIMSTALSHYTNAFSIGLFHARKAAALEPKVISHQEWLLSFYDIPDKIMSDTEACKIAQNILKIDPINSIASSTLNKINMK